MLLKDKAVVITGAGSGVGQAAARIFASHGARIVCADLDRDRVEKVVSQIRQAGGQAEPAVCDVQSEDDLTATIDIAVQAYGRLDVMFNNAGVYISTGGPNARPGGEALHECTADDYERLSSVNFKGTFFGSKLAVRRFIAQGDGGAIVNTASVAGLVSAGNTLYGATKGAVIQMTRGLAVEVAKYGIRVNAICPGGMITNFYALPGAKDKAEAEAIYSRFQPLGRPIEAEDAANAALFLASDLAKNITGVILPVDGGRVVA